MKCTVVDYVMTNKVYMAYMPLGPSVGPPGAPEGQVWNVIEYSQVRYRGKAYDQPSSNL